MKALRIAYRQLRSAWRSGEVRVLFLAIALSVAAMSGVGLFVDRMQSALSSQANAMLGGDLVIVSDHPIPAAYKDQATALHLQTTSTMEFPSMAIHGDLSHLAEIKAVESAYPLRQLSSADPKKRVVPPGLAEVQLEPGLAEALGAKSGDTIALGNRQLKVAGPLGQDLAGGGSLFTIAPRMLIRLEDVASTGLIQFGSRASYRLLLAGDANAVAQYAAYITNKLGRGERLEDIKNARPELRSALEKTQKFLGLASMATALLSMVAMVLASLRYTQKNIDSCALLRCLGASHGLIVRVYLIQALMIGLLGGILGGLLGMLTQGVLAHLASGLFLQVLPAPSLQPLLYAMLAGLIMLLAVLMPEIMRLSQVPAMHVLRRVSLETSTLQSWRFLPALLCFAALILLTAGNLALASYTLAGLLALLILIALLVWALQRVVSTFNHQHLGVWRLTMSNLQRRPWLTIAQVAGISLGFTAILLLTLIRGDVLNQWRASLPENAPNRFVINLQPEQLADVHSYFEHNHLAAPPLLPMVRGRLTALNGHPVYSSQYADEQTQRLVDREFNLSWAEQLQSDNKIVAGQWWSATEANTSQISIEEGIAEKLHIKLGDTLQYDIAGNTISLKVTSLRKVAWDSMHPNFFVIAPPGVFDHFPVSYIASFHLAADQEPLLSAFISQFPNATVIDVGAILDQLRNIINRMADAVQAVFVFSILSGLMVLYASLVATLDERQYENALLRTLGAKTLQIRSATLAEFACIGAVASGFAAVTATGLVAVMSKRVFDLDYHFNLLLPILCIVLGASFVALAAWMILRTALLQSPKALLQTAT